MTWNWDSGGSSSGGGSGSGSGGSSSSSAWNWDSSNSSGSGSGGGGSGGGGGGSGSSSSNAWNWDSSGGGGGGSGSSNTDQKKSASHFIRRSDQFQTLSDDKKKPFLDFEKNVMIPTNESRQAVNELIEKLQNVPDISPAIKSCFEQNQLLMEKLEHYRHELEPLNEKLNNEFAHVDKIQLDQRNRLSSRDHIFMTRNVGMTLPPPFYWEKVQAFQEQLDMLRKTVNDLEQYIHDMEMPDMDNGIQETPMGDFGMFGNRTNIASSSYPSSSSSSAYPPFSPSSSSYISAPATSTSIGPSSSSSISLSSQSALSPATIAPALQSTYRGTLHLAAQVIHIHDQVQQLKQVYRKYRVDRYGDTSDPFFQTSTKQRGMSTFHLQEYMESQDNTLELSGLQNVQVKPLSWAKKEEKSKESSTWGSSSDSSSSSSSSSSPSSSSSSSSAPSSSSDFSWNFDGDKNKDKDKDKDKTGDKKDNPSDFNLDSSTSSGTFEFSFGGGDASSGFSSSSFSS